MTSEAASRQSDYPIIEVVNVDGQPIWQICGKGICVRAHCGHRALELYKAECVSKGLQVPGA